MGNVIKLRNGCQVKALISVSQVYWKWQIAHLENQPDCLPEALISVLKFIEDDRSFTLENQPDCLPEPVEGQTG